MNKEKLFEQLKIDEGVKMEIYNDHLGYPTFGIGHLIKESDPEFGKPTGTPVSEERVREAFDRDCETAIREAYTLYGQCDFEDLPGEVQEILVNMIFNLGRPRLSKFKNFNSAILSHEWKRAAVEGRDSAWYRQVTNRAERLMKRLENIS
jgi:lysozyme